MAEGQALFSLADYVRSSYIARAPRFKFDDLRGALAQAESFARRDLNDLHWLGDVPPLREHVWLQYDFFILEPDLPHSRPRAWF